MKPASSSTFTHKIDIFLIVLLAVITFLYCGFYAQFHVDPHHDGIILKPAFDVLHGKKLFVETFTQYGALTTLIHTFFMSIFGTTLWALRFSAVISYTLISILLYKLWRQLFSPLVTFGLGLLWLATAYFPNQQIIVPFLGWSSVYALLFQLFAIWLMVLFIKTNKHIFLVAAGCSATLTFWARQPVGALLGMAISSFLMWRAIILPNKQSRVVELFYFITGAVLATLPFLVWLASFNGIPDWWQQSLVLAFDFGTRLSNSFSIDPILNTLFPALSASKKNVLWNGVVVSTIILAFAYSSTTLIKAKKTTQKSWIILLLAMTGLASWLQFFPAADQSHFFWAASPLIGLGVFGIHQSLTFLLKYGAQELKFKSTHSWRWLPAVSTFCLLMATSVSFFVTDVRGWRYYQNTHFVTLSEPSVLAKMRVTSDEAKVLSDLQTRLQIYFSSYPQKSYINISPDALYGMIDTQHVYFFHEQHVYWDWATETIFKDYPEKLITTVSTTRPLIIMREPIAFLELENYCQTDLAINHVMRIHTFQRPLLVRVPAEDLLRTEVISGKLLVKPLVEKVAINEIWANDQLLEKATPALEVNEVMETTIPNNYQHLNIIFTSPNFGKCQLAINKP